MKPLVHISFVIASLLTGCVLVHARTAHTGHLFVSLTDRESGGPITNAMVTDGSRSNGIQHGAHP